MSGLGTSIVRTLTPIIVGYLLALAVRAGFDITESDLTNLLEPLLMGGYYILVRFIGQYVPAVEILLGVPKKPENGYDLAA